MAARQSRQFRPRSASGDSAARSKRLFRRWLPALFSLRHAENMPIVAHWRRIFVLPTGAGWFLGLSGLLMLVASLNFNNNMGLLLTFWLMGLAQVLLLATFFNLKGIRLVSVHADPVHAGEQARVRFQLKAPATGTGGPASNSVPAIRLQWSGKAQKDGDSGEAGKEKTVTAAGTAFVLSLPVQQRGLLALPRLKIATRYPAGLFSAWIVTQPRHTVLVYPQAEKMAPSWPSGSAVAGQQWHHTSGEHFDGVRPYQYGDPLRLVAWKRSAQRQDLVSREYHASSGEKLLFDWQQVAHLPLEQALSRLTAWILRADDTGMNYRLQLPGFDSGVGQGHAHRHECLRALALFRQDK